MFPDGFRACPLALLGLLLDWVQACQQGGLWKEALGQWTSEDASLRVWLDMLKQGNVSFIHLTGNSHVSPALLAVRAGMALPVLHAPITDRVLQCYESWIQVRAPILFSNFVCNVTHFSSLQGQNLLQDAHRFIENLVPTFLSNIFSVLYMEVDPKQREKLHAKLFLTTRAVNIFRMLAQQSWLKLTETSWYVISSCNIFLVSKLTRFRFYFSFFVTRETLLITVLNGCNYLKSFEDTNPQDAISSDLTQPFLQALFDCYAALSSACSEDAGTAVLDSVCPFILILLEVFILNFFLFTTAPEQAPSPAGTRAAPIAPAGSLLKVALKSVLPTNVVCQKNDYTECIFF